MDDTVFTWGQVSLMCLGAIYIVIIVVTLIRGIALRAALRAAATDLEQQVVDLERQVEELEAKIRYPQP